MRILIIEPNLANNGAVRVTLDRAREWQRAGAAVHVLFLKHLEPHDRYMPSDMEGVVIEHASSEGMRRRDVMFHGLRRSFELARKADVVVSGRETDDGLLMAALVAGVLGRPLAVTVQSNAPVAINTYAPRKLRRLTRMALRSANLAICVSEGLVRPLESLGVPPRKIHVAHNGVDMAALRTAASRPAEIDLPPDQFIAASGRLTRQKGFDLLIHAHAAALAAGAHKHSLLILGEGAERSKLLDLATRLGVANSVLMPGHVENPHGIVARAALFALPSRWEGFGLSLLEALCIGTPVVAADCVSGPAEILDRGRYGKLIPPDDIAALAATIITHFEQPSNLRTRATCASQYIGSHFDTKTTALQHLRLLEDLVTFRRGLDAPAIPDDGII